MPRTPRLEISNVPLHVIQRGNNRCVCFFADVDRRFYLKCLREAATRRRVAIHAYVLMTNHVHLLATPQEAGGMAAMLQDLGRKYVRVINTVHGRTGTLWEGRYKSSLVASESYVLTCHRYIELNPVRAGMVGDPAKYVWSSHAHYVLGRPDQLITEHPTYLALGNSASERSDVFRALCRTQVDDQALKSIRDAINAGCAIGSQIRKRGRPPKPDHDPSASEKNSGKLF